MVKNSIVMLFSIILLLSFGFASENVTWIKNISNSQPLENLQLDSYRSLLNNTIIDYAFTYYDEYLYVEVFSPKIIDSKKSTSIQLNLEKDIQLTFDINGTTAQTKNDTNFSTLVLYPFSDNRWSAKTMISLKDLNVDKNCDATIDMNISVFDEQKMFYQLQLHNLLHLRVGQPQKMY